MKIYNHDIDIKITKVENENVVVTLTVDGNEEGSSITLKSDGTINSSIDGGEWTSTIKKND